jgi:ribonuclease P protein component
MGLIVPKFQSNAVARNRLRRRLSEIWRRDLRQLQGNRDLLIRIRKEAYGATFAELNTELTMLVQGIASSGTGKRERGTGGA